MKLTTKKIIAREFLMMIIIVSIGLILFLLTYPYNEYKRNQIERISIQISAKNEKVKLLIQSFNKKIDTQKWLFYEFSKRLDVSQDIKINTPDRFWNRLDYLALNDSIEYKWQIVWQKHVIAAIRDIGFQNPIDFQSFINKNRITKIEFSNYNSTLAINSEIAVLTKIKKKYEKEIFNSSEQIDFGLKTLFVCFLILFGFRYLIYALKWSLEILKQKSE
jgi:hypothetical protein